MFVGNKKALSKPSAPCATIREGKVLGARLLEILVSESNAVGLAANQVGVVRHVQLGSRNYLVG